MCLERLATLQIGRQRRTIVNVEIYQSENSSTGNNEQTDLKWFLNSPNKIRNANSCCNNCISLVSMETVLY